MNIEYFTSFALIFIGDILHFLAFYAKKLKHLNSDSEKRKHSEIVIKKQLKLVTKWKRCDIAWNDIFIAENRNELSDLQVFIM